MIEPTSQDIKTVLGIIGKLSSSAEIEDLLRREAPFYARMCYLGAADIHNIRSRLHQLRDQVTSGDKKFVIYSVIGILNRLIRNYDHADRSAKNHQLSDHAFCSGLRRYFQIDLNAEKDKMLRIAERDNWPIIWGNDGRAKTIYPPDFAGMPNAKL